MQFGALALACSLAPIAHTAAVAVAVALAHAVHV